MMASEEDPAHYSSFGFQTLSHSIRDPSIHQFLATFMGILAPTHPVPLDGAIEARLLDPVTNEPVWLLKFTQTAILARRMQPSDSDKYYRLYIAMATPQTVFLSTLAEPHNMSFFSQIYTILFTSHFSITLQYNPYAESIMCMHQQTLSVPTSYNVAITDIVQPVPPPPPFDA